MGPRVAGIEGNFFKTGFCFHLLGGSFNENPPILMQLEDQWAHLMLKLHLISWKMVERQVSRATPIQSGSSDEIFLPVLLKLFWCNFAFQVSGWSWFWTTWPPGHLTTWPELLDLPGDKLCVGVAALQPRKEVLRVHWVDLSNHIL